MIARIALVALLACAACKRDGPRYGALMTEVGRRFELIGRASQAGRVELARYQLHELEEVFEDDLPHAALPRRVRGEVDLRGLADAFVKTQLKALDGALEKGDAAAIAAAYREAAQVCNGCHVASGHAFIEVPLELGAAMPRLDAPSPSPN